MQVSHVAGGGIGALLGAVAAGLLHKFTSLTVSDVDAALIGSAALSLGVGLGHAIDTYGVKGLFARLWRGAPKPPAPDSNYSRPALLSEASVVKVPAPPPSESPAA